MLVGQNIKLTGRCRRWRSGSPAPSYEERQQTPSRILGVPCKEWQLIWWLQRHLVSEDRVLQHVAILLWKPWWVFAPVQLVLLSLACASPPRRKSLFPQEPLIPEFYWRHRIGAVLCMGQRVNVLSPGPRSLHLSYSVVFHENRAEITTNGCSCVSVKLYLYKKVVGQICGYSI